MDDFITNPHEREVCRRCNFEYLKSPFCRDCLLNVQVVDKSRAWCSHKDFLKFGMYEGINLGELLDYDMRNILFPVINDLEKKQS
jgi:hypothetical protein